MLHVSVANKLAKWSAKLRKGACDTMTEVIKSKVLEFVEGFAVQGADADVPLRDLVIYEGCELLEGDLNVAGPFLTRF